MSDPDEEDPSISFDALPGASWRDVAFADGQARYDIDEMTDGSIAYDDLTGGDPLRFAVHDGDLRVPGPIYIRNAEPGMVYVIEGSLVVDGPLVLADSGRYVPLWIRGDLEVSQLAVLLDAHLFIEGNLRVAGELVTYLKDAAHAIVLGTASAASWVQFYDRGAIELPGLEPIEVEETDERLAREVAEIPNKPLAIGEQVFARRSVLQVAS